MNLRRGLFLFILTVFAAAASPISVTITGDISSSATTLNNWFGNYAIGTIFDLSHPVTVTGSFDISGFATTANGDDGVLFIGLIAAPEFDASYSAGSWNGDLSPMSFQYFRDAYGTFGYKETKVKVDGVNTYVGAWRAGLGQGYKDPGSNVYDTTQTPTAATPLLDGAFSSQSPFLTFTSASATLDGDSGEVTRDYNSGTSAVGSFVALQNVDFSQGAIPFVAWTNSKAGMTGTYSITFSGDSPASGVPEPGSYTLLGCGLAALCVLRRRVSRV